MSYGGRRPTPRVRVEVPSVWAAWLVATALVAALGILAVIAHA